ncbi:similar to NIF3 NGG1 interacting factor 3-like 1 [Plenodomus lingam JN3]|uniref:Similar to NIF3 NGG1 interacting factor 3-like 1 n=2 Tax=Leptosphaeria maculans TaxID=5022 RepID=E5ACR6_LEPMJ|nr:similar to NIF3 NGG1 interacting factor 3-like 1 [Plenodomus lingam JN3]CBY02268.1 similar to NIF3 NGG1 interacting factor 3-like 1 [Plenodomus lingam JN3]
MSAPFSRAVVRAMQKLYPQALADNSWDNTGLLLEAPFVPSRRQSNTVFLAIDLTKAVADEAIACNSSIIVAYHPIIFRGLKSLTFANTQQQTLLRLASHGISVYSPHTAVDAAPGGLGDWLADIITGSRPKPDGSDEAQDQDDNKTDSNDPFIDKQRPTFQLHHQPSQMTQRLAKLAQDNNNEAVPHKRRPVVPQSPALESHPGAGMGRIVDFNEPQPLAALLDRIGKGLNNPKGFPIAIPQDKTISDLSIRSVGICAGSGGSLLANLDVDLLFTGEMSHHEALAAIEKGQVVISLFHSNSERGFLSEVLAQQLEEALETEWEALRQHELAELESKGAQTEDGIGMALRDEEFEVAISEVDRDPYGIVVLRPEAE